MSPTTLAIVAFAAVALLTTAVGLAMRDYLLAGRLAETGEGASSLTPDDLVTPTPKGTALDRWFDRLVVQTGLETSPVVALLLALAIGLALGGGIFVWRSSWPLAAIGLVLGAIVVLLALMYFRARRLRILREQLPDAITLLARSVQAGQTLDQGIALVGDQSAQPLAREFRQCALHLDMGLSVEAAMRALTRRVPLDEARILASTLVIQRRMGGDLPETLATLVKVIRDRLSYTRQFRAATTAPRLSAIGIALAGMFLLYYLWAWRPDYFEQLTSRTEGQFALGLAALMYVVGVMWTFFLLRPKY